MGWIVSAEADLHAYVIGITRRAQDLEMLDDFGFDVSIPADPFLARLHSSSHSRRLLQIDERWNPPSPGCPFPRSQFWSPECPRATKSKAPPRLSLASRPTGVLQAIYPREIRVS